MELQEEFVRSQASTVEIVSTDMGVMDIGKGIDASILQLGVQEVEVKSCRSACGWRKLT